MVRRVSKDGGGGLRDSDGREVFQFSRLRKKNYVGKMTWLILTYNIYTPTFGFSICLWPWYFYLDSLWQCNGITWKYDIILIVINNTIKKVTTIQKQKFITFFFSAHHYYSQFFRLIFWLFYFLNWLKISFLFWTVGDNSEENILVFLVLCSQSIKEHGTRTCHLKQTFRMNLDRQNKAKLCKNSKRLMTT